MFYYTHDEKKRIEALKKEKEKLWNQRKRAGTTSVEDTHNMFLGRDIDKIDAKIAFIDQLAGLRAKYGE